MKEVGLLKTDLVGGNLLIPYTGVQRSSSAKVPSFEYDCFMQFFAPESRGVVF